MLFLSILFPEDCDWEAVTRVVGKYPGAHAFTYSHGVYYNGDETTADRLVDALGALGTTMHIMRNTD